MTSHCSHQYQRQRLAPLGLGRKLFASSQRVLLPFAPEVDILLLPLVIGEEGRAGRVISCWVDDLAGVRPVSEWPRCSIEGLYASVMGRLWREWA